MDTSSAVAGYVDLSSKTSTFVSMDVVDSTTLKTDESEQDIIYTFLTYHKMMRELAYVDHGEVFSVSGDGIMCRFERPDDAATAVINILGELPAFNKRQNRLSRPFALRLGINTGQFYQSRSMQPGQLASHTIDVAAKLQQACAPNEARFSQETVSLLKPNSVPLVRLGWDAKLQTTAYQYSGDTKKHVAPRTLPTPVKVLVVEENMLEWVHLNKILSVRHYEVLPVYTSPQAALCTRSWRPHIIMASVDLSWNSGWDLLKELRADPRVSATPVILLSEQMTGEAIERCFGLGANGFLKKPFEEGQVQKRIDMVLREFYL